MIHYLVGRTNSTAIESPLTQPPPPNNLNIITKNYSIRGKGNDVDLLTKTKQ